MSLTDLEALLVIQYLSVSSLEIILCLAVSDDYLKKINCHKIVLNLIKL